MLICEGIFFILGLIMLFTGKFRVSRGRTVTGTRARVAGFILLLPLPIVFAYGFFIGLTQGNNPTTMQKVTDDAAIVELFAVIGVLILAVLIGITAPPEETVGVTAQVTAPPDIMTVEEAARYLRVSEADIRQMISTGQLRAVAIGDDYRISREALHAVFRS